MNLEAKSNLDAIIASINKKYKATEDDKVITRLTEVPLLALGDVISTGSVSLDIALGIGGYKKGTQIEIYGGFSSGKTTLCLHAIANAQKLGKVCCFIDAEQTFDPMYAKRVGIDLDKMLFCQPDYGEQALHVAIDLVKSGEIGLIVVDSVAALVPQKELEGDIEDQQMGLQARMMSKALRMLVGACNDVGCTIIWVNQVRQKIGVMYGSPNTTSGGNALPFYASQRLEISRIGDVKVGDAVVGNRTKVKVIKNKTAAPKKEAEFDIIFGKGIDKEVELIDLAISDGIIKKSGPGWHSYGDIKIGQGTKNVIEWLNEHGEEKEKIFKEVLQNRGLE